MTRKTAAYWHRIAQVQFLAQKIGLISINFYHTERSVYKFDRNFRVQGAKYNKLYTLFIGVKGP